MTRRVLAPLLLCFVMVGASCGGDSSDTTVAFPATTAPPTTVAPTTTAAAGATTTLQPAATTTTLASSPTVSVAPATTEGAGPVVLVDQGFTDLTAGGQGKVSFAVVFENQSDDQVATSVDVSIEFFDAGGGFVGEASDEIDFVMPGTKAALADTRFDIPDAASMEVNFAVQELQTVNPEDAGAFQITSGGIRQGGFSPTLLAIARSSFDDDIVSPEAGIVYYGSDGAIIGGDFSFLSFVPGNGELPFLLFLEGDLDISGVEVLVQPSILSTIEPSGPQGENLSAAGVGVTTDLGGMASYGLILSNPNPGLAAEFVEVVLSFWDGDNRLVGVRNESIGVVLPGEAVAVGGEIFEAPGAQTVIAQWLVNSWTQVEAGSITPLEATDIVFTEDTFSNRVRATVVNPGDAVAETVQVVAVLIDESGDVIGGGFSFLDFIPAGGSAPVEISTMEDVIPDRVLVFPRRTLLP